MIKDTTKVARWEAAIGRARFPDSEQWGKAFRKADPEGCTTHSCEEDIDGNAIYEFESVAGECRVGQLSLESVQSTHGDGSSVCVYVLPKGKTVFVRSATWEREGPSTDLYLGGNSDEMLSRASDLLWDESDYGLVQDLDENPDYDPDAMTIYQGEKGLLKAWRKAKG